MRKALGAIVLFLALAALSSGPATAQPYMPPAAWWAPPPHGIWWAPPPPGQWWAPPPEGLWWEMPPCYYVPLVPLVPLVPFPAAPIAAPQAPPAVTPPAPRETTIKSSEKGAEILDVIAAKAAPQLIVGDVILDVNGVKIETQEAFEDVVRSAERKVLRLTVRDARTRRPFRAAVDISNGARFVLEYKIVTVDVLRGRTSDMRPRD